MRWKLSITVSWNSVMLSCVENGRAEIALEIFQRIKVEGVITDARSFVAAIKACSSMVDPEMVQEILARGMEIHKAAVDSGCDSNIFVAVSLIDLYGRCKCLDRARTIFEAMHNVRRSVVSWNTLILRYADNGEGERGLELFDRLIEVERTCAPDSWTFAAAAKACAAIASIDEKKKTNGGFVNKEKALSRGLEIDELATKCGFDSNTFVGNSLVNMYVKFESLMDAKRAFDRISYRSVVSWNSLMFGYVQSAPHCELVLDLFPTMVGNGCQPDARSFLAAVRACATLAEKEDVAHLGKKLLKLRSLEKGMFFHSRAVAETKNGELDVFVTSALVDMYMKCGTSEDARRVFDSMPRHNAVSWTALLTGYVENGEAELTLDMFSVMLAEASEGVALPAAVFLPAAKACSVLAAKEEPRVVDGKLVKVKSLEIGMSLHSRAEEHGFGTDLFLANTLLDMYSKCSSVVDALRVFNKMVHHDVASWNALILACADNGEDELALELLQRMQAGGDCLPNARTFAAALKACGNSVDSKVLTAILAEIWRRIGGPGSDGFLDACLVDACGKCGRIDCAQQVFDSLSRLDLVVWNALIAGYSRQGDCVRVFHGFYQMQDEGLKPDEATFVEILTACSHAGLVARSRKYFLEMRSRANQLENAVDMAKSMSSRSNAAVWKTVLSARYGLENVALATLAWDQ